MSEHADAADFTPRAALETLARATAYEEPLRQRTEGITWMVYGLATAGIFMTYAFFGASWTGAFPWWGTLLWAPWIAGATLTAGAIWNSAALAEPRLVQEEPSWRLVTLLWLAFFAVTWVVSLTVLREIHGAAFFLLLVGTAWFVMGITNLYKCSRRGVRVGATIGGLTALVGLALAVADGTGALGTHAIGVTATIAGGLVPMSIGYWQTRRG